MMSRLFRHRPQVVAAVKYRLRLTIGTLMRSSFKLETDWVTAMRHRAPSLPLAIYLAHSRLALTSFVMVTGSHTVTPDHAVWWPKRPKLLPMSRGKALATLLGRCSGSPQPGTRSSADTGGDCLPQLSTPPSHCSRARPLTHTDFGANADKARQMTSIWRAFFICTHLY